MDLDFTNLHHMEAIKDALIFKTYVGSPILMGDVSLVEETR